MVVEVPRAELLGPVTRAIRSAALVEESAAAAESLKQQAAELTLLVAAFKVDE